MASCGNGHEIEGYASTEKRDDPDKDEEGKKFNPK